MINGLPRLVYFLHLCKNGLQAHHSCLPVGVAVIVDPGPILAVIRRLAGAIVGSGLPHDQILVAVFCDCRLREGGMPGGQIWPDQKPTFRRKSEENCHLVAEFSPVRRARKLLSAHHHLDLGGGNSVTGTVAVTLTVTATVTVTATPSLRW